MTKRSFFNEEGIACSPFEFVESIDTISLQKIDSLLHASIFCTSIDYAKIDRKTVDITVNYETEKEESHCHFQVTKYRYFYDSMIQIDYHASDDALKLFANIIVCKLMEYSYKKSIDSCYIDTIG